MVVGSPGIVADNSYDVINMGHVKKLNFRIIHNYCEHRRFRCLFYVRQKVYIA